MKYKLKYKRYSENAILIEWPSKIDENILQDLLFYKKIIENEGIKEIVEIITAYNSILIYYESTIENVYEAVSVLKSLYSNSFESKEIKSRLWEIPVCYSPTLAPDLKSFSKAKSLTVDEVISLHTAVIYKVYFLGFLPGFCYLGGLNDRLFLPRKSTPSLEVKKGSVAIGGNQTGIYPLDSPGGWHVIGKCPLNFFDANLDGPSHIIPNDNVQFMSISEKKYNDISAAVLNENYFPEPMCL